MVSVQKRTLDQRLGTAYGAVAAGVSSVDPSHFNTNLLGISLGVAETAHVLVVIGGPVHGHTALGPQERDAAAVTLEYVQGVLAFEGVIYAQFTLAFVQSECFQCFYEHDILKNI